MAKEPKSVEFGTDEWGKWASGVQDRIAALEKSIEDLGAKLDDLAAKAEKVSGKASGGDDTRMKRVEQMLGIK